MEEKIKKTLNIAIILIYSVLFMGIAISSARAVVICAPCCAMCDCKPCTPLPTPPIPTPTPMPTPTPTPTLGDVLQPEGTILRHIDGSTSIADGTTRYDMSKWSVVLIIPITPTIPTTPTPTPTPTPTSTTPSTNTISSLQQQILILQQQILILQQKIALLLGQLKLQKIPSKLLLPLPYPS